MRSGVCRSNRSALRQCDGAAGEGAVARAHERIATVMFARLRSSFTGTGRADSMTGHSAMPAAPIAGPSEVGSCAGQCRCADSRCAVARHAASHHARAGAAAPTSKATMRIERRFTGFHYIVRRKSG